MSHNYSKRMKGNGYLIIISRIARKFRKFALISFQEKCNGYEWTEDFIKINLKTWMVCHRQTVVRRDSRIYETNSNNEQFETKI